MLATFTNLQSQIHTHLVASYSAYWS